MDNNVASVNIGFTNMLGLIFIVLKLTETIAWSWWWVLSPFIIQTGIAFLIMLVVIILMIKKD